MKILAEIIHDRPLPPAGRTLSRQAVRAIILREKKLLMIHAQKQGDYKFPGGGVAPGESHTAALLREVAEESGANNIRVIGPYGKVIEYAAALEAEYDRFEMTSSYYWCEVGSLSGVLKLDPYEADLGFHPLWVDLDFAIAENARILQSGQGDAARWVRRELTVLENLKAAHRSS